MARYDLLTIPEAARQLPRSHWWYYDKIKKNEIAYHKIGGQFFIAQDDLDRLVAASRHAPHGERPVRIKVPDTTPTNTAPPKRRGRKRRLEGAK